MRSLPVGGERLAEGIGRMRRGEVIAQPGYDGEYGVIRVFGGAARVSEAQMGLFGETRRRARTRTSVENAESGERGRGFSELVARRYETVRVSKRSPLH